MLGGAQDSNIAADVKPNEISSTSTASETEQKYDEAVTQKGEGQNMEEKGESDEAGVDSANKLKNAEVDEEGGNATKDTKKRPRSEDDRVADDNVNKPDIKKMKN